MKIFDKTQIVLGICAGISIALFSLALITNTLLSFTLDEESLVIPNKIASLFLYMEIFFVTWFLARLVTFQMRKKELEEESKEY